MASAAAAAMVPLDGLLFVLCVVCCVLCVVSCVLCVVCCESRYLAGGITVCLLRFGVNGSFYLNPKKISVCRLVQSLTSLPTSSVQVLYMFHTPNLYWCCRKIDNVDTL